jgi:RIO-like serine/threonine protein kinase
MMALTTKKGGAMIAECIDVLGPVGIKLAQLYAEDSKVSPEWKDIIASTKEKNRPSSIIEIYKNIRNYGSFEEIGKCIGVGSIKQVHFAKSKDNVYHILGIRKLNCESKAKTVLNALKHISEFRQIATDLEKIIDSEVNLNDEAYAFDIIQTNRFRESGIISFTTVVSSSLSTILRTKIDGDTVNTLYSRGEMDDNAKDVISKFHTLTLDTCFDDSIVFSDFHMGNITFNKETKKITVIDVGQYKAITSEDKAISLWLMADLGTGKKFIHDATMNKLKCLINIKDDDNQKVDKIFQEAYTYPVRERFSVVSSRLAMMGYYLPDSVMRICKMTDLVIQQREELGIKEDTLKYIEKKFRETVSYTDLVHISFSWLRRFGN